LDLEPPIERQYKPFQKHVSSYQVERSPGWFVSPKRAVLRGALVLFNEDNSLRGENTVADSNPERVKARSGEIHPNYYNFKLIVVC
jgi:hypothetical protein